MAVAANVSHSADREKIDQPDPSGHGPSDDKPANGRPDAPQAAEADNGASETETVDRDALHQADYGGARPPAGIPDAPSLEETQQGGVSLDEATGSGRKPTAERDRDYDPDGDRTGL